MGDQQKPLIEDWSEEDVSTWLRAQGLEELVGIFQMNNIDGKELLHLTKESLAGDLKIGKSSEERAVLRSVLTSPAVGLPAPWVPPLSLHSSSPGRDVFVERRLPP